MNNAKSREHAHTCRKARAIFKLRYKESKHQLSGTICLTALPLALESMYLDGNNFEGSLDFTRLPESMRYISLSDNRFSGTIDLVNLPKNMLSFNVRTNALSGTVRVPPGLASNFEGNEQLTVEHMGE